MSREDFTKLDRSELLYRFLLSRDNLVSIKRAMFESQRDSERYNNLSQLFDTESEIYNGLMLEMFRRMK